MPYSDTLGGSFAEIRDNNIRAAYMTQDRKFFYHSEAWDCEGVYDMTPQEQRLAETPPPSTGHGLNK